MVKSGGLELTPECLEKVTDAAIDLTEVAVNSFVGFAQLQLQNLANQHLSDLKTALGSLQMSTTEQTKKLATSVEGSLENADENLADMKSSLSLFNQHLQDVEATLVAMKNETLGSVNEHLSVVNSWSAKTNQNLEAVLSSMGRLESIHLQNASHNLDDVKTILGSVESEMLKANHPLLVAAESLGEEFKASQELVCRKLDDLKSSIETLTEEGREQKKAAQEANKMQRIEFALENVSLVAEDFPAVMRATKNPSGSLYEYLATPQDMDWLLKRALLWMHKGEFGMFIEDYFIDGDNGSDTYGRDEIKEEWKEAFRKQLSESLYMLLGKKPRFSTRSDGHVVALYE